MRRFSPSFLNTGSALTWILIYRSPGFPPDTASPAPVRRIISPGLIPAGTLTVISDCLRRTPAPLQILHFSFGTLPLPLQVSQVLVAVNEPMNDLRVSWIDPCPLH